MTKSYRSEFHGQNPYYDDFDPSKKFVRIMSRPGFPLQSREVTQLQTILQSQIERLGDHFFEEGASVKGGEITELTGKAVRLKETSFTTETLDSFIGKKIVNSAGVEAQVVSYADASPTEELDNFQILFVSMTTSGSFAEGQTITILGTLPQIEVEVAPNPAGNDTIAFSDATNVIGIGGGIYFADGFFVETEPATITVAGVSGGYRTFQNPTASIGFQIKRDLISSDEDDTLKDPSFGFYNFNSPGADRYKISLELTQKPMTEDGTYDSEDYFEIMQVINGQTTKQVRYTDYALFEETLARRTFDESGNYTVRPFPITLDSYATLYGTSSPINDDGIPLFHVIKIDAGKAYVGGYEYETISPRYVNIERGLTRNILRQRTLNTPLKNFVNILKTSSFDSLVSGDEQNRDAFTANRKAAVQRVDENGVTTILGTCNLRTIEEDGEGNVKLYLFNVNMSATGSTNAFARSTHIAVRDDSEIDNTQRFRIGTTDTDTAIEDVGPPRQIFKAPIGSGLIRASGSDGLVSSFLVKKAYNFELTSGQATITSTKPFLPPSPASYVLFYSTNTSGDGATMMNIGTDFELSVSNNTTSPTLTITKGSNIPDGGKGTLIASQQWQSDASANVENNIRTKTLVDGSMGGKTGSAITGIVNLNHADVYSMTSINDGTRDVTNSFDLEVNSGIDAYRISRIVLKAGATCATDSNGDLIINSATYKYFSHSGDGPFTVDSYPLDQLSYDDIPDFTDSETGETYSLADAFDFRPVATGIGVNGEASFDNGSGGSQVVAYETPVFFSTVSYEHYLGRVDSLVLDRNTKEFRLVKGAPSVTPKSPEIDPLDMHLGNFVVPPYTKTSGDIKYRYIDNQRTTMNEINELESTQQFDSFFTFKNDLEQEALNRAQNFRSSRTAFSDGIFVDTFIGHNNSVTSKRDHNCSIDPEFGELRPAFESTFIRMGITGASLGSDVERTDDNVYVPTSQSGQYAENLLASDTISANQFSVADYLGTMTITPSSDNFFTTISKPKVIVNTVGEVDNWEALIIAFQRGRKLGFGSQWRDWETLWFGSKKRNDVNIEHDSSGSEYTRPRRSSFVSRIISDKLIKKIGNKIVDLSVVPFTNSRTITVNCQNLKPRTAHYLYFDGVYKGPPLITNEDGSGSISFSIESATHLTGKKLIRVTDDPSGVLSLSKSSADGIYYAEGLLETKEGDSFSIRPVITRRKASNVDDVSSDYYDSNASNNLSRTFNSQTPFAQEIFVDPTNFPNGIMLKNIVLFFSKLPPVTSDKTDAVKVHVRPMFNGAPHPFKVLPFSESTLTDISENNFNAGADDGTQFNFSSPVYLKPNTSYAICITTNSNYQLYYGERGEQTRSGTPNDPVITSETVKRPRHFGPLHLPLNNGTVTKYENRFLKMIVNRCIFNNLSTGTQPTSFVEYKTNFNAIVPHHAAFIHSNEQVSDSVNPIYSLTNFNFGGGSETRITDVNTTIDDFETKKIITTSEPLTIRADFITDEKQAIASMIDGDRLGYLAIEYMANNDDAAAILEELQPTSRLATNRSRYVGRKVTLDRAADDIVVIVDGSYVDNSQIKVYVKLQGPDQPNGNFDDNDYEELFPEGNPGEVGGVAAKFAELKPEGPVGGVMRFTTNNLLPGTATEFTAYQIKILLMGQDVNNEGNAKQIPVINTVSAVPLRRLSQDEIRRYVPPGSVLQWAGGKGDRNNSDRVPAPFGFVNCNGALYNYIENPEFKVLFEAIGNVYNLGNEDTSAGEFRVPDIRSRVVVGRGRDLPEGVEPFGGDPLSTRLLGVTGGEETHTLTERQLPPHTHRLGTPIAPPIGDAEFGLDYYLGSGCTRNLSAYVSGSREIGDDNDRGAQMAPGSDFKPYANETADPFILPNSMAGDDHNNMQPFIVLDYIIKI